jgi:hypothetical protein
VGGEAFSDLMPTDICESPPGAGRKETIVVEPKFIEVVRDALSVIPVQTANRSLQILDTGSLAIASLPEMTFDSCCELWVQNPGTARQLVFVRTR